MRGFLKPAFKPQVTEPQSRFASLSRHRRARLAAQAQTDLLRADRWASGSNVPNDVAQALEKAMRAGS